MADRIELSGVDKAYGAQSVLSNANLTVDAGEFLVVMGRSGSGKSTLLKLVGGLEAPDAGSIRHGGRELGRMDERERTQFRRRSLGFVFQFFNLIPTLTVAENVSIPLALNRHDRSAQTRRIAELLDELGLSDCGPRLPDQLSGGEQQRAAIARALIHAPDLVLADEPTGNLDVETASQVLGLLRLSCRERDTTLIMATHSVDAADVADRVVKIDGGALVPAQ